MFRVKGYGEKLVSDKYPVFCLTTDSWNDFGTVCTFNLRYHKNKTEYVPIGQVKILQKDASLTKLPSSFASLGDKYISLGQQLEFYKNLWNTFGTEESIEVLEALNDISWQPNKAEEFESKSEYRNALFRNNSASTSFRFGRSIILGEEYKEDFSFEYTVHIEGADGTFNILVDFDETDVVPGRIVGVIGRNAVGKTQLMGALAKDLVQVGKVSQKAIDDRDSRFRGDRPIFNRVITISYSAFDKFIRPKDPQASYVYCGIRNDKGALSRASLVKNYKQNLKSIVESQRSSLWVSFMAEILDDSREEFVFKLESEVDEDIESESDTLSVLSSGQSILAHFVTALLARIQENTLVLFDEPETHLHPNAVAHLFNVINRILKKYNSFAIIATHSPIVIQEIPKKRVILLTREGNSTMSASMSFETFGENLSELTRHVFDTVSIPNYYKKVLKNLSKNRSFEEVSRLFDDNLSFNAKAYLLAQYGDN